MRARWVTTRCPGDYELGLNAVPHVRVRDICILDSPRSRPAHNSSSNSCRALLAPCLASHRLRKDAPPSGCEGALGSVSARCWRGIPGTKVATGQRDPAPSRLPAKRGSIACEDDESSRVRPDHVLCCIVLMPPRNRPPSDRQVTKDEGAPGRGSHVRFTPCAVSRSSALRKRTSRLRRARGRSATGTSDVARTNNALGEKKRSTEAWPKPPKRATAS